MVALTCGLGYKTVELMEREGLNAFCDVIKKNASTTTCFMFVCSCFSVFVCFLFKI